MFLWSWMASILHFLGFRQKSGKLLFLGLANAGKTSLLYRLRFNKMIQAPPTAQPTSEELTLGGLKLTAFDMGGHRQARRVWKEYFPAVDGIVFIVDVEQSELFVEAKAELDSLLRDDLVHYIPIVVLGNKIDKAGAVSENEIKDRLGLHALTTGKGSVPNDELAGRRPLELFMCSVLKQQGYGEGIRWLANYIK